MYQDGLAGTRLWMNLQLSDLLVTNRDFVFQIQSQASRVLTYLQASAEFRQCFCNGKRQN